MSIGNRNGKIELMRFIMSLFVIIYHAESTINEDFYPRFFDVITLSKHGCMGVEFFFLLSGFFMAKSAEKEYNIKRNYVFNDSTNYVLKRYITLLPPVIISFFAVFTVNNLIKSHGLHETLYNLFKALPDMLMFSMTGVPYYKVNGLTWYLSSLIIGFIIIYPFCRKFYKKFSKIFAPVIALLLLTFLFTHNEPIRLSAVYKLYGFLRVANIRAVCELLLGVCCYELSKKIGSINWSSASRKILTVIEFSLIVSLCCYIFSPLSEAWQYVFLFVAFAYIAIVLSGASLGNEIFNKKWINYLGKLSLNVYLIQYVGINIAKKFLISSHYIVFIIFSIVVSIILSVIIMPLSNKIVAFIMKLSKKYHLIY